MIGERFIALYGKDSTHSQHTHSQHTDLRGQHIQQVPIPIRIRARTWETLTDLGCLADARKDMGDVD